jgi:hypothetical protein
MVGLSEVISAKSKSRGRIKTPGKQTSRGYFKALRGIPRQTNQYEKNQLIQRAKIKTIEDSTMFKKELNIVNKLLSKFKYGRVIKYILIKSEEILHIFKEATNQRGIYTGYLIPSIEEISSIIPKKGFNFFKKDEMLKTLDSCIFIVDSFQLAKFGTEDKDNNFLKLVIILKEILLLFKMHVKIDWIENVEKIKQIGGKINQTINHVLEVNPRTIEENMIKKNIKELRDNINQKIIFNFIELRKSSQSVQKINWIKNSVGFFQKIAHKRQLTKCNDYIIKIQEYIKNTNKTIDDIDNIKNSYHKYPVIEKAATEFFTYLQYLKEYLGKMGEMIRTEGVRIIEIRQFLEINRDKRIQKIEKAAA